MASQSTLGKRGFDGLPRFASYILTNDWAGVDKLAGISEGWTVPVAHWQVPGGFDITTDPALLDHHVIKWRSSGAQVHATRGKRDIRSDPMTHSTVCLQAAHSSHRYWAADSLTCMHLYLPKAFIGELARHSGFKDRRDDIRDDALFVTDRPLRRMVEDYAARALMASGTPLALEMDARAVLIGLHIARRYGPSSKNFGARQYGPLSRPQLSQALEALTADMANPPQLGQLARAAGMSIPHFVRSFAASTGMPPHRWLIRYRLERACALLSGTDLSILDVAVAVGYSDPSYFARIFCATIGVSPSDFRRSSSGCSETMRAKLL